jgi:hypothetical protein
MAMLIFARPRDVGLATNPATGCAQQQGVMTAAHVWAVLPSACPPTNPAGLSSLGALRWVGATDRHAIRLSKVLRYLVYPGSARRLRGLPAVLAQRGRTAAARSHVLLHQRERVLYVLKSHTGE